MNFLEQINKSGSAAMVWAVWVFAFIGIFLAVSEAHAIRDSRIKVRTLTAGLPAEIVTTSKAVNGQDYEKVAERIRLMHPSMIVRVNRGRDLEISSKDVGAYYNWIMAIYDTMTVMPDLRWDAQEMCAGTGCRGSNPYSIRMTADRVKIEAR